MSKAAILKAAGLPSEYASRLAYPPSEQAEGSASSSMLPAEGALADPEENEQVRIRYACHLIMLEHDQILKVVQNLADMHQLSTHEVTRQMNPQGGPRYRLEQGFAEELLSRIQELEMVHNKLLAAQGLNKTWLFISNAKYLGSLAPPGQLLLARFESEEKVHKLWSFMRQHFAGALKTLTRVSGDNVRKLKEPQA